MSRSIKVIVFDFDGVIIDSNRLKYNAFFQIFPPSQKIQRTIKQVLAKYREESRYFIIEKILTALKKDKSLKKDIDFYTNKYGAIVEKQAVECNEIKGARKSLEGLSKYYALYINSTTPLPSLKRIISQRSLSGYFKGLYGGPKSKAENLHSILKKEKISAGETLIVGDGKSDLDLAQKFGCRFIGIRNRFNNFDGSSFKILDDLTDLKKSIDELNL